MLYLWGTTTTTNRNRELSNIVLIVDILNSPFSADFSSRLFLTTQFYFNELLFFIKLLWYIANEFN